jgi:hypothetical protein
MSYVLQCSEEGCSFSTSKKKNLDYHMVNDHQNVTRLTVREREFVVNKSEDGFYHCNYCSSKGKSSKGKSSKWVHKHIRACITTSMDEDNAAQEENNEESTAPQNNEIPIHMNEDNDFIDPTGLLEKHDLFYDTRLKHMYCKICSSLLEGNIELHMRDKHKRDQSDYPAEHDRIIKALYPVNQFILPQVPVDKHPILPIHNGFCCTLCKKCSEYKRSLDCYHNHAEFIITQKLQRTRIKASWFPVIISTAVPSNSYQTDPFDFEHFAQAFQPKPVIISSEDNLSFFQTHSGFFKDRREIEEAKTNEFLSYFDFDYGITEELLTGLFKEAFSTVDDPLNIPYTLRLKIGYGPLSRDVQDHYILYFVKRTMFIINFTKNKYSSDYYLAESELHEEVEEFLRDPSIYNLFQLLTCTFQEKVKKNYMTVFLAAMRVSCLNDKYILHSFDHIQQNCSKAIKLSELTVLMSSQLLDTDHFEYINQEWSLYFGPDQPYSMALVYSMKALAQHSEDEKLPRIAKVEGDDNSILLDGDKISLDFFPKACTGLLESIKEKLKFLCFGEDFSPLLDKFQDNWKKDAYIGEGFSKENSCSTKVLNKVMNDSELKGRFFNLLELNSAYTHELPSRSKYKVVLNHAAKSLYKKIHDERLTC